MNIIAQKWRKCKEILPSRAKAAQFISHPEALERSLLVVSDKRPVHIVCAPKEDYLAIITAYIPSLEKWETNFKTRRKK